MHIYLCCNNTCRSCFILMTYTYFKSFVKLPIYFKLTMTPYLLCCLSLGQKLPLSTLKLLNSTYRCTFCVLQTALQPFMSVSGTTFLHLSKEPRLFQLFHSRLTWNSNYMYCQRRKAESN